MVVKNVVAYRNAFIDEVRKLSELLRIIGTVKPPLKRKYFFLILELGFLRIYAAWEEFLENTFISYVMSSKSSSEHNVKSYFTPKSYEHAQNIINEGRGYVRWEHEDVIKRAMRFLKEGKPYVKYLRLISTELGEIEAIRNRIAHNSKYADEKFKSIVRSRLAYASYKIDPGKFLFELEHASQKPFYQFYIEYLVEASKKIIS